MIRRFRRTSIHELKERAKQFATAFVERTVTPFSSGFDHISFFQNGKKSSNWDYFAKTLFEEPTLFYAVFGNSRGAAADLKRLRQKEYLELIARADRICIGDFDLLGIKRLSLGKVPDWHFEPLSGKRSPYIHWSRIEETSAEHTGDKKVIWELNRHQYFLTLGQAYWLTNDEKYASTFVQHLEDWMNKNPPKIGVNWLSSLELAFRAISWIWAYHFFKDSPALTSDVLTRILKFLYLGGRHIESYLSTFFSPNTHLTGEALGLYFIGSFMPDLVEAQRWKSRGYQILIEALDFQVRPDGTYCEQASHYLRYTIDFYCNLLILRRLEGFHYEPQIELKLTQLFDHFLHITMPNGESPNFGDDDAGRLFFLDDRPVTDFRPTLALGAVLFRRGDLKLLAGEPSTELLWLTGEQGPSDFEELETFEPAERVKAFPNGGYFTARSDWSETANYIAIDCGPHGFLNGGHAHADALGFVMALDGRPVFIDSGTYNYTSQPSERDRFRSTAAHNCLTVNNQSSSVPDGPFSWKSMANACLLEWSEVEEGVRFRGTHDGYERYGIKYEREIFFHFSGQMEIREYIESRGEHNYKVNFILSPSFRAEIDDAEGVRIRDISGSEVLAIKTLVSGSTTSPPAWVVEQWFVSPLYGAKVRSERLFLNATAPGDIVISIFITRI